MMKEDVDERDWFERNPPPDHLRITKNLGTLGTVFKEPRVNERIIFCGEGKRQWKMPFV